MTIWNNIKYNPYRRPKYTKWEISSLVKQKRQKENLNIKEFADKYNIDEKILIDIEQAKRSFNIRIYRVCSSILGMSINELYEFDEENKIYGDSKESQETIDTANTLFHEIIMQNKINS